MRLPNSTVVHWNFFHNSRLRVFGGSDEDTQTWPVTLDKEAPHVDGNAKASRGLVEWETWHFW